jgi:hypothetical protein
LRPIHWAVPLLGVSLMLRAAAAMDETKSSVVLLFRGASVMAQMVAFALALAEIM